MQGLVTLLYICCLFGAVLSAFAAAYALAINLFILAILIFAGKVLLTIYRSDI